MKTTEIVLEVRLPIRLKELAAIARALEQTHGKHVLWMRQDGAMLQFCKPQSTTGNNIRHGVTSACGQKT
jgi:hypothetical protein